MIPDYQLTVEKLLLQTIHRGSMSEIVYDKSRYTWADFHTRIRSLASGLERLGVSKGSKVAVLDFNSNRYLEAYFAIPMMGAMLHTVNIRLPPEHIAYTMAHAEDDFVILRDDFIPLMTKLVSSVKTIKGVVTMSDTGSAPSLQMMNVQFYDDLVSQSDSGYQFPELEENTPATIFYTSGTTGLPKGVWFDHRQLVLHTLSFQIGLSSAAPRNRLETTDVILPLVPFFHVHCWGIPYLAGLNGQKIVLAGRYDPSSLLALIARERVTFSNMVPTVLNMILSHRSVQDYARSLSGWKVLIGGSALPRTLAVRARRLGLRVMSGYGLSETAPLLTLTNPTESHAGMSEKELLDKVLLKAGIPLPLLQLRVVDTEMREVPRDGKTPGEIVVRGPWLTKEYYREEKRTEELWAAGWLHTGDMAVIDGEGYVTIVDRMRDAIKSGGEWIPTITLEDILMSHAAVSEAAVIGVREAKWGERPMAIISLRRDRKLNEEKLRGHIQRFVEAGRIAKFWVPDRYVIGNEPLPKTSTGKIDKKQLRQMYSGVKFP